MDIRVENIENPEAPLVEEPAPDEVQEALVEEPAPVQEAPDEEQAPVQEALVEEPVQPAPKRRGRPKGAAEPRSRGAKWRLGASKRRLMKKIKPI